MPYKVDDFDCVSNKAKEEYSEVNISNKIFKVIFPNKISLFTDADNDEKVSKKQ